LQDYTKLLEDVFPVVKSEDITDLFVDSLKREMAELEKQKDSFLEVGYSLTLITVVIR
jgi:hypothetical protein